MKWDQVGKIAQGDWNWNLKELKSLNVQIITVVNTKLTECL